ncbi:hypothetical protein H6P81_017458 [Aristolochia fimbriata]|uniref:Prephenate/arogenate dehydrogenase domain-containing protein n=1 Tax=Aristolochia fimbriata TaxID=158543 RepID=A0AAV7DYL8_ARIFI|nr:hypothetical protein H6P81_017458 [Aristolochia fimbriata]
MLNLKSGLSSSTVKGFLAAPKHPTSFAYSARSSLSCQAFAPPRRPHCRPFIRIRATAQPSDPEAQIHPQLERSTKLKIAIVGFGNFGQFLAKTFVHQGHVVQAFSRTDYSETARNLGVSFFKDPHDLCEEHPEVIVLSTSITSTESVLESLPLQRLKRNTLFVDVLSVKEFPKKVFLKLLPPEFDILCTHPMFGPESGKDGWEGLTFVYEKVRVGNHRDRIGRCDQFLQIFAHEGCDMKEMSCEEHDRYAAGSQFITHTVGRVLGKLGLQATPINTKGYESLLKLVENTQGDSYDLYYALFLYNLNAIEELEKLEMAFESVKNQLLSQLHEVLRKQLFNSEDE